MLVYNFFASIGLLKFAEFFNARDIVLVVDHLLFRFFGEIIPTGFKAVSQDAPNF